MYRAPRGTQDILPLEQGYWRYIRTRAEGLTQSFGYGPIDTPIFERAELFTRTVGEQTDVVQKEMYTFEDKSGELLTLRPEGTAPVCRAYLEHGMYNLPQPVRLYYTCPIFRYERPQAGRYRQHHQFGVEVLGDGDPSIDAEVIQLAWQLTQELGLKELSLNLNSIGDPQCRPGYLKVLRGYYSDRASELCGDCKVRLERNTLRLLDCKVPSCQAIAQGAPQSIDHLCAPCDDHWNRVIRYMGLLGIPFRVNPRLVRGFDYYTRTVFEIEPSEARGQSTILGGGRYDGLIQELGGRPTPGIGFAAGIERLAFNLKEQGVSMEADTLPSVVVTHIGDGLREEAVKLVALLHQKGIRCLLAPGERSLKGQMRYATSVGARYALIMGEEEMGKGQVTVKDMESGEQSREEIDHIVERLRVEGKG